MKKPASLTNTRHSRESGNLFAAFPQENRADIADGRLRIPAFAGMTKYYSMVIVFYNAVTSAIRLSRSETPRFVHTLESGNPEAAVRYIGPVFLAETPQ